MVQKRSFVTSITIPCMRVDHIAFHFAHVSKRCTSGLASHLLLQRFDTVTLALPTERCRLSIPYHALLLFPRLFIGALRRNVCLQRRHIGLQIFLQAAHITYVRGWHTVYVIFVIRIAYFQQFVRQRVRGRNTEKGGFRR